MDKRKLSLLLKRNIRRIESGDVYEYLDRYVLNKPELDLSNKLKINSLEKSLLDIKDVKKFLNHLSKLTGYCVFIISKNHLFYSGNDASSDYSTFNKLTLFRHSLKDIENGKLLSLINQKSNQHDFNVQVVSNLDKFQIEDSLLVSVRLPNSNLNLGVLGALDSDLDTTVNVLNYLYNSQTFNERLSRIFF